MCSKYYIFVISSRISCKILNFAKKLWSSWYNWMFFKLMNLMCKKLGLCMRADYIIAVSNSFHGDKSHLLKVTLKVGCGKDIVQNWVVLLKYQPTSVPLKSTVSTVILSYHSWVSITTIQAWLILIVQMLFAP